MKIKQVIFVLTLATSLMCGSAFATPILWVGDTLGNLGKVDVATGNVDLIGDMGHVMTDIAFDSSGNLFGITFNSLYSIDTYTATSTLIGNHTLGGAKNSLVFGSDNTLYAANSSLYSLNIGSGASTLIGGGGGYSSSGDLAFIGDDLFLSSTDGTGNDRLFLLDETTGIGTDVGSIGFSAVYGLSTDNNIDLYGVTGTSILDINTATGLGSSLVSYGGNGLEAAYGSAFYGESGATVPEPTSFLLMGIGLVGLGASRIRKNRNS